MLLTGCVTPNVTDKLNYAAQPEERKRQYVDAIRWYLDHTPYKLVFAENSGCDLSPLFEDYKDRTEFLTYKDTTISNRSKGYKEMEILEYVRDTSRFIGGGKSNRHQNHRSPETSQHREADNLRGEESPSLQGRLRFSLEECPPWRCRLQIYLVLSQLAALPACYKGANLQPISLRDGHL